MTRVNPPTRRRLVGAAALGAAAMLSVAAVGVTAAGASTTATAPLPVSATTAAGSWVSVPMGHLDDPTNTFWELFWRPVGGTAWTLVTPRGVADNGGLVLDTTPGVALVGFEPSQALTYSPLAASTDQGSAWSPGLVPTELADVPDALAGSAAGDPVALVRTGGGQLLSLSASLSSSHVEATTSSITSGGAGRSCGLTGLSAVALDAAGHTLVGGVCTRGPEAGVFEGTGGASAWTSAGLVLAPSTTASRVLRLTASASGTSTLLEATTSGGHRALVGAWRTEPGASWTRSGTLALGRGGAVLASGTDGTGGYLVLTGRRSGALGVSHVDPGGSWRSFAAAPPGTQAVVARPDGGLDAAVVAHARFTDWSLAPGASGWVRGQSIEVPIEYGSSN